ncbi:MAG: hypothetical protein IJ190_06110 [Prevotella sp.]|nr:hypothetical protein [Prevotella sp.]
MRTSESKYPKYRIAVDAVMSAIKADDDTAVESAIQQLYAAQDEEMSQGASDLEGVFLQFRGAIGAIENHLRKGDVLSASLLFIELSENFDDMCVRSSFTLEEIWSIEKLMRETAQHVRSAIKKSLPEELKDKAKKNAQKRDEQPKQEKPVGLCTLCREKEALCTGSHLAPHLLIQSFLSYNGTTRRDTEVVNETTMAGLRKVRKWGRSVPEEAIDEAFGEVPIEEKVTIKPSAVTRDYIFCKDCENRFGYVETAYATSFRKQKPCDNSLLAYVFWLGVFWRLSVGKMALQLNSNDEKFIGDLLHRLMPHNAKDIKDMAANGSMGNYGYRVYHCANTKGELSGVIGKHTDQSPYCLLIGEYVVVLYSNKDKALKEGPVNDFEHGEQWQEISFIEYWKMKQQILDANAAYENRHMGEEREKIVDVIKGNHVDHLPSFLFDSDAEEITYDDLKGQTLYQLKIPGSLEKIMTLTEQHPEADTPEKRHVLVEEELGYTREEMQEMFDYWSEHAKIRRIQAVSKKVKKSVQKTKRKEKQKRRMQKNNRKKNRRKK